MIKMNVESGTYARKLAYDIGEVLGVGANMRELRRTRLVVSRRRRQLHFRTLRMRTHSIGIIVLRTCSGPT